MKLNIKTILLLFFLTILGFIGWLLYRIPQPDITDKLFMAIDSNNIDEAKKSIDQGADINAERGFKSLKTSLMKAVWEGSPEMVGLLLSRQATTGKGSSHEQSPLDASISIALGSIEVCGTKAPWKIIRNNQKKIIPLLIATHTDTTYQEIILAILTDNFNLVKKLSKESKEAIKEDAKKFDNILDATVVSGNKEIINYVFKNILDYNAPMKKSKPVQVAIKNNDEDIIDYILSLPITDINASDEFGNTPLDTAVLETDNKKIVKKLLEMGANPNSHGRTPLHRIISYGNRNGMAKVLLEHGANPNIQDGNGNTVLHEAMLSGNPNDIAKLLLEYGADPMIKNNKGKTPNQVYYSRNG